MGIFLFVSPLANAEPLNFDRDVRPILANHCLHCHGPDAETREADLRFDTPDKLYSSRGGYSIINRDEPAASELVVRLKSDDPDLRMPPPDSPSQPTEREIATLERWIDEGAEWSEHWSFVPPKTPKLPATSNPRWANNPIDLFIAEKLEEEGLSPSPQAKRATLIRRASLILTGLPPKIEEVDAFEHNKASDAYEQLIDRLLQSPRYGEHMAFAWLDAARYADTSGYQADWERFMWPWRDWVVRAFNDNMPFDQFTVEQLAGDLLPNATLSQKLATGFNRNHRINDEGGSLDAEFEVEYVVDRVDTTATIWLGLTAGCARCHDHKYDPLSQHEFYQLYAYFNNVPEKGIDGRKGAAKPFIAIPNENAKRELARQQTRLDSCDDEQTKKKLNQQIKQLKAKASTQVMVMQELSERKPTYLLKRGEYDQPDKSQDILPALPRAFEKSLAQGESMPTNRLEFANWLVASDNPLVARVTVNRIWQHHFGRGLVKTTEDFGTRGDRPSHPELLDWLATELIRLNWDVKAIHRLIVTSATFQQSSTVNDDLLSKDPENVLLARGPRIRLSAAAIRDQALLISGLLCETMGGPSVKPYQPPGLWKELSFGTGKTTVDFYEQDTGTSLYRRGLYTFWKRTVAPPRMAVFDGGGREMCRVRSDRTNTPLQALTLQNDVTFVEAARHLAERMMRRGAEKDANLGIEFGWRSALSRRPSDEEQTVLRAAYYRYLAHYESDPKAAEELLSFGESGRDQSLKAKELAAYTMVALSILNLDETITRD